MIEKYSNIIDVFISALTGVIVAGFGMWITIKKYFNFKKESKERDEKTEVFKKEVNEKVSAQNKKIESLHETINDVKSSTILHIDIGFKNQDRKNETIFPQATEVYARFEKLEIARENMFRLVMIEQKNLSEKQNEIVEAVKEISTKLDSEKDHEIEDLKQQLRNSK